MQVSCNCDKCGGEILPGEERHRYRGKDFCSTVCLGTWKSTESQDIGQQEVRNAKALIWANQSVHQPA